MLIQQEIDVFLKTYGTGLSSKSERDEALYNLLQQCKKHTHACGQAVRRVPFHAILMSIVLEQQKQLMVLADEITTIISDSSDTGGSLS